MNLKKIAASISVAALVAVGVTAAAPAMAAVVTYDSYTESDDPAPMTSTHALVFFKAASINFAHLNGTAREHLVPLADVDGLAYTVAESTSYAPSYQIDVVSESKHITYARLVWEPYMQTPPQGKNTGAYADLEKGSWWANRVFVDGKGSSPFGSAEGSQSKPQPLSFFTGYFGTDAQVDFFGLKQGSSTDSVSTVTSLTFRGENVPLGTVDKTPFDSKDVDAAVAAATAPLTSRIDALEAELKEYKADHQTSNTDLKENYVDTADGAKSKWTLVDEKQLTDYIATHPLTTDAAREGYVNTGDAAKTKWNLVDESVLDAYMASHPLTTDGAQVGYVNTPDAAKAKWNLVDQASLVTAQNDATTTYAKIVSISGTKKVGKTVTARTQLVPGCSYTYRWYVGGKSVKHATKATFKLSRSRAHHALSVRITTSWIDLMGVQHSVSAKARYLRTAYIAR